MSLHDAFLVELDRLRAAISNGKPYSFTFITSAVRAGQEHRGLPAEIPTGVIHLVLSVGLTADAEKVEGEHRPAADAAHLRVASLPT